MFKTRTFARWSRKAGLPDRTLCAAVAEMSAGLVDAELAALQRAAAAVLEMDVESLGRALQAGELTEICDEEEPHTG